jgi:hypothetical protein
MDLNQIQTAKAELEQEAGALLGKLIKNFEEKSAVTVRDVRVSIDTLGTPGRDLQRHYDWPRVSVTLEGI